MVAHVAAADAANLIADAGKGADGVVRVRVGSNVHGSGVLLYDGRHVLTARHLLANTDGSQAVWVSFETPAGTSTLGVTGALGLKTWSSANQQDDLVLLALSEAAPLPAQRYQLYRDPDEIGQPFVLIGYGVSGTGDGTRGAEAASATLRRYAENRFDGEMGALHQAARGALGWTPPQQTQLWADFDNGLASQDATALWTGQPDLGRGSREGLNTPGDSGAPAFVGGLIAGIASYTFSASPSGSQSDIDRTSNSSFGEIGVWQRVSQSQQWIDQNLRASYPDAPTTPEQVQKRIPEGNAGTSYAYFLLQFTGVRANASDIVSVDYATRDGTATAGQDYLATSGILNLYPGEDQAVIAVEILGDTTPEADETLYLDVTHPVGGSFGAGVVTLTAMRTLINDDGGFA